MKSNVFDEKYRATHMHRFRNTLNFARRFIEKDEKILDVGVDNPLSELFRAEGYSVTSSPEGIDFDYSFDFVKEGNFDVVTAFEILEHMVSPFPMLRAIEARKLIASVPLRLWFATAHWREENEFARHYHEFEPRQFEMLLNKAGWKIIASEKWKGKFTKPGIRPLLRRFTDRYMIVCCVRDRHFTAAG